MPPAVLERFERTSAPLTADVKAWLGEPRRTAFSGYRRERREVLSHAVRKYMRRAQGGGPRIQKRKPWEALAPALRRIRDAIEESKQMRELGDDWDGEGSLPVDEAVWQRAVDFLARYARVVWERFGKRLDAPDITPGPDGSIDLHWDHPEYEMLVNIRRDLTAMAGFYGDDRGRVSIKGTFDPESPNEGLVLWLKKAR